jgi:hypothetical protein
MPVDHPTAIPVADAQVLAADGLVLAPVAERGPWAALRALRSAMVELRRVGLFPAVSYVYAISGDGRIVAGRDPGAAVFVLAYRLAGRTTTDG